jgi:homocysteine S-methyltransferase
MMRLQEYLQDNILLFDGGMGVYYNETYPRSESCEMANLEHPERIRQIHEEYIKAGAMAIKTNTFAANTKALGCSFETVRKIIRAAWTIACEAAEGQYVFADIGPIGGLDDNQAEYEQIIDTFLVLGATHFLFETFTDNRIVPQLAKRVKDAAPDAFVIASYGVMPEGFTASGQNARTLLKEADASPYIDAAGLNCVSGPGHLQKLVSRISEKPKLLSVMPNAGYPTLAGRHTIYGGKPDYFAECVVGMTVDGVRIVGGCCGTTPEFIRQTRQALDEAPKMPVQTKTHEKKQRVYAKNPLSEKLDCGQRIIAVELDPPANDDITTFLNGAKRLNEIGIDAVTIADCPVARTSADSSMLAAKLHRELGIQPIPHMTCRDRNLNATKALLLGLSIEEIYNVLLVTGDPIPTSERDKIKAVFSFHSANLASYVQTLSEEGQIAPFRIYGALNVNAPHFDAELKKAKRKEENGVSAFLTQPVMTDNAFSNLHRAASELQSPILGGIYPIVSERNARFMNSEVSGVEVPQDLIERYAGLDREEAEELAVTQSLVFADRMKADTAGYYIMTPFQRVHLVERIVKEIKEKYV